MNSRQRNALLIGLVAAGGFFAKYLSYPEPLREINNHWLSFAILSVAVAASAFVWLRREP